MRSWLVDVVVYFLARQRRVATFQKGVRVIEAVLARSEWFCLRKLLAYSSSRNWAARYLAGRGLPRFYRPSERKLDIFTAETQRRGDFSMFFSASLRLRGSERLSEHLYPGYEAQGGPWTDLIEERMRSLAADEDPRVREGIATGLAELGRSRFSEALPLFRRWSQDPSEPMRRAILAGTVSLVPGLERERLESLMDLWEGLLKDPSRTIRRELVRNAVGSALVERDPRFALLCLRRWLSWEDPQVDRQISYLLLTSPLCQRYPREVGPILAELAERYAEDKVQGSGPRDQGPARDFAGACPELVERGRSLTTDPCFTGAPAEAASVIRIRVGLALRKQGLGVRDS